MRTLARGLGAGDSAWFAVTTAHVDERADDDTDHVIHEPVASDHELDATWRAGHLAPLGGTDRARGGGAVIIRAAKSDEIVSAEQRLGLALHRVQVQRIVHPPG